MYENINEGLMEIRPKHDRNSTNTEAECRTCSRKLRQMCWRMLQWSRAKVNIVEGLTGYSLETEFLTVTKTDFLLIFSVMCMCRKINEGLVGIRPKLDRNSTETEAELILSYLLLLLLLNVYSHN